MSSEIEQLCLDDITDRLLLDTHRRILLRRRTIDNVMTNRSTRLYFTYRRIYYNLNISLALEQIENNPNFLRQDYLLLYFAMARVIRRELPQKREDGSFKTPIFHGVRLSLP